jgi:dipeptidyl aminopeptidase/acylaminoacyl peptidase
MIATAAGVEAYEGEGGHVGFPSHANCVVIFNGEFDMWDLVERGSLIGAMRQFIGATPEEVPEKYDELSSVQHVHADVPPTLQMHGTQDTCVSHEQAIAYHEALQSQGVHSELEIYEGKPHAWFNKEPDRSITYDRMERFLKGQFGI